MRRTGSTRRSRPPAVEREVRPAPEVLNIEVTLPPKPGGLAVIRSAERPSLENIDRFYPTSAEIGPAITRLAELGFEITAVGSTTVSVKCSAETYRRLFSTQLSTFTQEVQPAAGLAQNFLFPREGAPWALPPELEGLIEDAYIQWPAIYFQTAIPPRVRYHHLRVPGDVSYVMSADLVHRAGTTGRGVRVAMVDSGFYTDHPYFRGRGYNMSVILAPGATHSNEDGNGHGTAECANIFAMAPDVTFIGIKLDNEDDPRQGASLAEGFKTAVAQNPDIITVSMGYDVVRTGTRTPLTALPNSLKPLEAEVKAAVSAGIIVIFAAGNGHVAFPGMMPEVLSAGGTYVDQALNRRASDYASAFASRIYPGRRVPDVTGLVGMVAQNGAYIMLPLQPGCQIDRSAASRFDASGNPQFRDGTAGNDGWAVISGTSAAAPQLAGVCALLKQENPGLTPQDAVSVLKRTARDVLIGAANPASNNNVALPAGPGPDGATGHGLVDAFAAWRQV